MLLGLHQGEAVDVLACAVRLRPREKVGGAAALCLLGSHWGCAANVLACPALVAQVVDWGGEAALALLDAESGYQPAKGSR